MSDRPTDSEMLDWLERRLGTTDGTLEFYRDGMLPEFTIRDAPWGGGAADYYDGHTLRDAIASAMSASPSSSEPTP